MTMTFWTTGENMTRLARDFWYERNCVKAIELLNQGMSMPTFHAINLVEGRSKLEGNTREDGQLQLVEDDTPDLYTVDGQLTYHTERYIDLKRAKIEERFYYQSDYYDNAYLDIDDLQDDVINSEIRYEKELFETMKQIEFLCLLSDKSIGDVRTQIMNTVANIQVPNAIVNKYEEKRKDQEREDFINDFLMKTRKIDDSEVKLGKPKDSYNGWISPEAEFYICSHMGHIDMAHKLYEGGYTKLADGDEDTLEKAGWMKLSAGDFHYVLTNGLTKKQMDFVMDYKMDHMDTIVSLSSTPIETYDDIEKHVEQWKR